MDVVPMEHDDWVNPAKKPGAPYTLATPLSFSHGPSTSTNIRVSTAAHEDVRYVPSSGDEMDKSHQVGKLLGKRERPPEPFYTAEQVEQLSESEILKQVSGDGLTVSFPMEVAAEEEVSEPQAKKQAPSYGNFKTAAALALAVASLFFNTTIH